VAAVNRPAYKMPGATGTGLTKTPDAPATGRLRAPIGSARSA
jgi:hypothetical protein